MSDEFADMRRLLAELEGSQPRGSEDAEDVYDVDGVDDFGEGPGLPPTGG